MLYLEFHKYELVANLLDFYTYNSISNRRTMTHNVFNYDKTLSWFTASEW